MRAPWPAAATTSADAARALSIGGLVAAAVLLLVLVLVVLVLVLLLLLLRYCSGTAAEPHPSS